MSKKVSIATKPQPAAPLADADAWVKAQEAETVKRLTLDIPASLHQRIKVACAMRDVRMVDAIKELLEERFPKL